MLSPAPPENPRRAPIQSRAQLTVSAIFEATAQIVDSEGVEALSTNKVAKKAGFSIGTLYQYFRSKEAIIAAMSQRAQRDLMAELDAFLSELEAQPDLHQRDPREAFRQFIRIGLASLASGGRLRRSVIRLCWLLERPEDSAAAIRVTSERLAISFQRIRHPLLREPTPAVMFVVSRAIIGCYRSASIERSPLLGSSEMEDELVQMVWGMLAKSPSP
jgi:AcrR family transcriptional regulator